MGWTFYHAEHYKKDGYTVDRKAECDALWDKNRCEVVKSVMVGSVYYAALRELKDYVRDDDGNIVFGEDGHGMLRDIPLLEQSVVAHVVLTGKEDDYYNFGYKAISEDCGPCECDCPKSILNLLTPTDSKWANEWRERCFKSLEAKRVQRGFNNLPYGSQVRFTDCDGVEHILTKHEPAYQFKTWFWYEADRHQYVKKKLVTPENAIPVTLEEVVV